MTNFFENQNKPEVTSETPAEVEQTSKPRSRRKPVKSLAERLAEAQAKANDLRAQIEEQIDRDRLALVEELYKHHGVERQDDDLDESKRLAALRRKLGLD